MNIIRVAGTLLLFLTISLKFNSQTNLPYDYEGHPITRTTLQYTSFRFEDKRGGGVSAYTLVDNKHNRAVVPHHSVSGYYFNAVPASADALSQARANARRGTLMGWGSLGLGFTGAGLAMGLMDPKSGDTAGPLIFVAGFGSGIYFFVKTSLKSKKDFNNCISTFNTKQDGYLPSADSLVVLHPDKVIHTIKTFKGVQYERTSNKYVTKVESVKFNVGQEKTSLRFNRKNLKPYLLSTPASARLWKKATLHRTMKLSGLGLMALSWAGGSAFAQMENEAGVYSAMLAGTAGFGMLCTTKVSKLLTRSLRAYNMYQYSEITASDFKPSRRWQIESFGLVPIGTPGRMTSALSLRIAIG
ncbi:MAG: hypothetical protein JNM00_07420 [Flavobacteriales bacterium]|nr:hypothetical protein [Flavobacteriales bacterium]